MDKAIAQDRQTWNHAEGYMQEWIDGHSLVRGKRQESELKTTLNLIQNANPNLCIYAKYRKRLGLRAMMNLTVRDQG